MSSNNMLKIVAAATRLPTLAGLPNLRFICTTNVNARSSKVNLFDINFDRRIQVDYKESMRYMDSEAYKRNYFDKPVWHYYKRNFKGQFASERTRPNCVGPDGFLMTSYPCSICRDEYLVLHPENVKLLSQFIDPYTGSIMSPQRHGLCLKQYRNLIISITQARDLGNLTFEIPDRLYDYSEYYEDHKHC